MLTTPAFRPSHPAMLPTPASVPQIQTQTQAQARIQAPDARTAANPSLAWLLAYGLNRAAVQRSSTHALGPSGEVVHNRMVDQSWQQVQDFCARPAPDPVPTLREQARMAAAETLRDGFKARLKVVPAVPGASEADRWAALQKSLATAYMLGLPVTAETATRMPLVEEWTPKQVFGRPAGQLVALLQRLKMETLAELGVDRIPAGEVRNQIAQAANDFIGYVDECIDNVGYMLRDDGSRRQRLSAATLAQIRRTAYPAVTAS